MRSDGRQAALTAYGLDKVAGVGNWLRGAAIGAPGSLGAVRQQFLEGSLTKPGGAYHGALDWLKPKFDFGRKNAPLHERFLPAVQTLAHNAFGPGMVALQGYQALTAPEGQRGEAVGRLVGGLAGGTLGAPFGVAGQMAGSMAGDLAGSFVGKQLGSISQPKPSPFDAPQQ